MLSISSGGFLLPNSAQTVDKLLPYAVIAETSQNQDIEYNESDTTLRPRSNTISGGSDVGNLSKTKVSMRSRGRGRSRGGRGRRGRVVDPNQPKISDVLRKKVSNRDEGGNL